MLFILLSFAPMSCSRVLVKHLLSFGHCCICWFCCIFWFSLLLCSLASVTMFRVSLWLSLTHCYFLFYVLFEGSFLLFFFSLLPPLPLPTSGEIVAAMKLQMNVDNTRISLPSKHHFRPSSCDLSSHWSEAQCLFQKSISAEHLVSDWSSCLTTLM